MTTRGKLLTGLGAILALGAGPARAGDARSAGPPEPDRGAEEEAREITGRLRVSANELSLELGGASVELSISGGESSARESQGGGELSGTHELRATISVNDRTTHLVLRISSAPGSGTAAPPK